MAVEFEAPIEGMTSQLHGARWAAFEFHGVS